MVIVYATDGNQGTLPEGEAGSLADLRHREAEASAAITGAQRLVWLPYHDSGMRGWECNTAEGAFMQADVDAVARQIADVLDAEEADAVFGYDWHGGYGHPDHIQAHRVATYAVTLAAAATFRPDLGPAWDVAKVYWTAFPRSVVREGIERLRAAGETTGFAEMDPDDIPFVIDDALVTTAVSAPDLLDRKLDALRAHATQVTVDGGFFALADNVGAEAFGTEYFRLVRGRVAGPFDAAGRETDLFAGI